TDPTSVSFASNWKGCRNGLWGRKAATNAELRDPKVEWDVT
ncbi:MAG: hypothetical protein QOH85_470, partial [Acidobacteriaceae bacterium]|nr:hypothetical protein [Acidobacteriaceae bacterium]